MPPSPNNSATLGPHRGEVIWFDDAKGYGFIRPDSELPPNHPEQRDVYVHYSAIAMTGRRRLLEGQRVTYELVEGPKGPAAHNVEVVT